MHFLDRLVRRACFLLTMNSESVGFLCTLIFYFYIMHFTTFLLLTLKNKYVILVPANYKKENRL